MYETNQAPQCYGKIWGAWCAYPVLGVGIQSALTGGGAGVVTVAIETSPMIRIASLHAWYCRSISSRFRASSWLSSIMEC